MPDRPGDADRRHNLAHARIVLGFTIEQLAPLLKAMREALAGYPTGHEGGGQSNPCPTCRGACSVEGEMGLAEVCGDCEGRGWVSDHLDRTESAALNPDRARQDLGRLDHLAKKARGLADEIDGLGQFWLTTTTDMPEGEHEPGCSSCKRIKVTINGVERPMWEPRRELPGSTREKPRFSGLCRWCDDWNRAEDGYPPVKILRLRHQGVKITEQLLARHGITPKKSAKQRQGQKKAS